MKYLNSSFSMAVGENVSQDEWDRIFGRKFEPKAYKDGIAFTKEGQKFFDDLYEAELPMKYVQVCHHNNDSEQDGA
jgi:hypothetical protein